MNPYRLSVGALLALLCLAAAPARAQEASQDAPKGVWFAGGMVSDASSAYAGVVYALPDARLGKGLAIRATVNAGDFDYVAAPGRIEGRYAGGDIALVYQFSGSWGWANVSAGPRISDITLSPVDPGNRRRGTRIDLGVQADGALDGPRWRVAWLAGVGANDEAYNLRAQIGRKLGDGRRRIGVEAGAQGDPFFSNTSVGGFVALPLGKAEVQLSAGVLDQEGQGGRAYGGLSISRVF